jgi:hypothetical protein
MPKRPSTLISTLIPETQLIDALKESYGLLKESGGPMWTAAFSNF